MNQRDQAVGWRRYVWVQCRPVFVGLCARVGKTVIGNWKLKPVIGNFTGNRLTDNRITTLVSSLSDANTLTPDHCWSHYNNDTTIHPVQACRYYIFDICSGISWRTAAVSRDDVVAIVIDPQTACLFWGHTVRQISKHSLWVLLKSGTHCRMTFVIPTACLHLATNWK